VDQVGNQYVVNSWCTVRKTLSYSTKLLHLKLFNMFFVKINAVKAKPCVQVWRKFHLCCL